MQRRRERMHRMSDAWRIENSLCSSATFKEGRRFLAAERNYVLADAPGDVAKDSDDARACTVHYCMRVRACVWAGLLELSSAYLRCTMHSLSLPTLGRQGEANSSLYRSSTRKNSLLRSSRRTLGGWLSKYNTRGCWEKNINFEGRSYVMIYDLLM